MEVVVKACAASDIFDDPLYPTLAAEYACECGNQLIGTCAPRREVYEALLATGMAQCLGVSVDGLMCGFAFVLMAVVPHYDRRLANVETLFVAHAARSAGVGGQLMEAVESYCRDAGCAAVLYSAPVNSRLARLLFLNSDTHPNTGYVFTRSLA